MSFLRLNRIFFFLISIFIFTFIITVPLTFSEVVPEEVIKAAKDGITNFLEAVTKDNLEKYGFSSNDDLAKAILGPPIKVYTITLNSIQKYAHNTDILSILETTNQWFFPILLNGEYKVILTIDLLNGEWKAVSIGASGLAKQLKLVKESWPQSKNYEHKFIRIFQLKSDFIILSRDKSIQIYPLISTRVALKLRNDTKKAYNPTDIITELASLAQKKIELK